MALTLFGTYDKESIVMSIREQLQALHGVIEVTDRVKRMVIRDSVVKCCPELAFHARFNLIDEIYEEGNYER